MLGLTHSTPPGWVLAALENLDAVLVDHAHCEMKAATNALSLAIRAAHEPDVARELLSLADEELAHFRRVFDELVRRNIPLGLPPQDEYAAELRKSVRAYAQGAGPRPLGESDALVDRLLVAALIEARSCERFRLLSEALRERGPADLYELYQDLLAAEARHFRTFVDLARKVARQGEGDLVDARLREYARLEGELASRLTSAPAIHG
jgi:tRNA-(ms[2]io[6]A)-hydroxylase